MKLQEAKEILIKAGHTITSEERLPNDTGYQLRIDCGAVINIYDKGTYNIQGKEAALVREALKAGVTGVATVADKGKTVANKRVFVVYGHDKDTRDKLETMLRRWDLEPIFMDQIPSEGQTIIEKLESATKDIGFAIILATADDEGHRMGHPDENAPRVRQNVVLELGMLLALLGRKRVAILLQQIENMERPSDIQGLIYIPFKDDLEKDAGLLLAKEMTAQGFDIDIRRL
jgi:predicted nucleotide-binding protein